VLQVVMLKVSVNHAVLPREAPGTTRRSSSAINDRSGGRHPCRSVPILVSRQVSTGGGYEERRLQTVFA
jgi:hypothetical protein